MMPESSSRSPRLRTQLHAAARVGVAVRAGVSLPEALQRATRGLSTADRGAVQDISYRTMRRRGSADALLALLAERTPADMVRELLVSALALVTDPDPPYAEHVLVDQAVEAVPAKARGFVNAILRRCLRERGALDGALAFDPVARYNYPRWWIDEVRRTYPEPWEALLEAGNRPPPMTLRVNRRRASLESVQARFAHAQVQARAMPLPSMRHDMPGFESDDALVLERARPVAELPGFREGWWSVQDAGAQSAAPLLDARDGMRVLDACAAPGGKATHILERADCRLLALDSDAARLARVRENLERLGLSAELRAGDAARPDEWWDGEPFDRILADVPCTASGIVRRHPDIRWLRRHEDIDQLATTAARILEALWRLLKPDGTMLFATCSIFVQEGETQVRRFLARHPDAIRLAAPGQLLPTHTDALDHDGFFYARVAKRAGH